MSVFKYKGCDDFKSNSAYIRERSLFRAGEGVDDIREGLWIFGKCWKRGYGISTEKKGGVTRNK